MTVFKTAYSNKFNTKPHSIYKQGMIACFSFCIGTIIYGMITDLSLSVIFERMFFQTFSIMSFCFIMNQSYRLYDKERKIDQEFESELKKEKEDQFNF